MAADRVEHRFAPVVVADVVGYCAPIRGAVPGTKQTQKGRIISFASSAGFAVSLTGIQSYTTSKAGQIGLVRQLAHEFRRFGIPINAVAPGVMCTDSDAEEQWRPYGEDGQRVMEVRTAMRRLGKPEDISNSVMFFASDHADWVAGQALAVTGSP